MTRSRAIVLTVLLAFVAACQNTSVALPTSAASVTSVTAAAPSAPVYAAVLDHDAIHSAADARLVARQALDLAPYPDGARRLAARPPAGLKETGSTSSVTTQITTTRWESAPGTVADAAAWMVAHAAAGTGIVNAASGSGAALTWTTARAGHYLPFGLAAWIAPEGTAIRQVTRALDTSTPERADVFLCARGQTATTDEPNKLEVLYRVAGHTIRFYWSVGDCPVLAVVDGKRATYLTDPPTVLVERALHWRKA